MNKRIIGLGVVLVSVVSLTFYLTSIGSSDNCVTGAQEKPPPGAPTPNAQQMQEWPTIRAQLQSGSAGQPASEPTIPANFTMYEWIDAQPAEDLGEPVGGSAILNAC